MTTRMLPPSSGLQLTITVNGRVYTAAANGILDMPDFDAAIAAASGWIPFCAKGGTVGATAARPTTNPNGTFPVTAGTQFMDTTVGGIVVADGAGAWRNSAGAVA